MNRATIASFLSLTLAGALLGDASTATVGVAIAEGAFRVDQANIYGNSTVFEGSAIETGVAAARLRLAGGIELLLASASRATVHRDRLVLEKGAGQLQAGNYQVEALGLRVVPAAGGGAAVVSLAGPARVHVAALAGTVRVWLNGKVLLANVATGRALEFEPPQAGAAAPTTLKGILKKQDGRFLLTDETTGVIVELVGKGLERYTGKRIRVTGSQIPGQQPAAGASQVVQVSAVTVVAAGTGAAAGAGMTIGTKAVIAGVIIGGAATGTAVGLTRGEETPVSQ